MKVRCRSTAYTEEQRVELGIDDDPWMSKNLGGKVTIGKEYLVFGLEVDLDRERQRVGPFVTIIPDVGYLLTLPLCLFQVTDPRVSRHWEVQSRSAGTMGLYPPSFYREPDEQSPPSWFLEGYLQSLDDDQDPATAADFERVCDLLVAESEEPPTTVG